MTTLRPAAGRDLSAAQVHQTIADHMLADGYDMVLDLDASHGSTLIDARDGTGSSSPWRSRRGPCPSFPGFGGEGLASQVGRDVEPALRGRDRAGD